MIAGVMIDSYKLATFKRHLDEAGYQYTEHPGLTRHTRLLRVQCEEAHQLKPVVEAANAECHDING